MDHGLYVLSLIAKTAGLYTAILGRIFERDAFIVVGLILMLSSWYLLDYYHRFKRVAPDAP